MSFDNGDTTNVPLGQSEKNDDYFHHHFVIKQKSAIHAAKTKDLDDSAPSTTVSNLKTKPFPPYTHESKPVASPEISTLHDHLLLDHDISKDLDNVSQDLVDEVPTRSTVASLIAKFNQAAETKCTYKDKNGNILMPTRLVPRFVGYIGGRRRKDEISQNNENAGPSSSDKLSLNQGSDAPKNRLDMSNVVLKYFPEKLSVDSPRPLSAFLSASLHTHLDLGEHISEQKHSRKREQDTKSLAEDGNLTSNSKPVTVVATAAAVSPSPPLCPFYINKRSPLKNINLMFGKKLAVEGAGRSRLSAPVLMDTSRQFSPELRSMSENSSSVVMDRSRSQGSQNFPVDCAITFMSPMDKNNPAIKTFLQSGRRMSIAEDVDKSAFENRVLEMCIQKLPIPMNIIIQGLNNLNKVGEGVYGEVFIGEFNCVNRVYKIVPIEGTEKVNGENQKTFSEIFPEIAISRQLSKLHFENGYPGYLTDGYIKMHNSRLAKGKYPDRLVNAWKIWDQQHKSDNECPEFPSEQLYMIFECDYGGKDAESFEFKNSRQAFYLVLQVTHILAVGESAMEFEHRDLHWGNILVRETNADHVSYTLDGKVVQVPSGGIKGCIIDFTLARITDAKSGPVFYDLKDDEEQFLGAGDHQFNIYRMMRDCNRNEWAPFCPKTNIYWIHYLADKLLCKGRYLETTSEEHLFFIRQLRIIKSSIMQHDSALDFVLHKFCEDFKQIQPR